MSNDICITGNLTAAPALRFTQNGRAVLNARIADTPRRKNNDTGEWEDAGPTLFVNVTLWGQEAEALAEIMGDRERGRLTAWGTLGLETYTGRDGEERETLTVKAEAVKYHPPRGATDDTGGTTQRPPQPRKQQGGGWPATHAPADPWAGATNFPDQPPF